MIEARTSFLFRGRRTFVGEKNIIVLTSVTGRSPHTERLLILRTRIAAGVPFVGDCFVGITRKAQMKRAEDNRSMQFVSYEKITVCCRFSVGDALESISQTNQSLMQCRREASLITTRKDQPR